MTAAVSRGVVEAFYNVFGNYDADKMAAYLDDDVEWTISGPIDLLPFCGKRRGKEAVLDLIGRLIPSIFHVNRFLPDVLLVDGEWASAYARVTATRLADGRTITYRLAQFMRFRNSKIVAYCSVIDSFDAVEQVMGQRIDLAPGIAPTAADADVIRI